MGNHLKEERLLAGMTQAQASEASGIPLGTLRRWEQGVNEPDIESIILLADLYKTTTDNLLGSKFARHATTGPKADPRLESIVELYQGMDSAARKALHEVAIALSKQ